MCSDDYKLHTSPHTNVQIDEHDDLESIMSLYVYGPIDYDSCTLIVINSSDVDTASGDWNALSTVLAISCRSSTM